MRVQIRSTTGASLLSRKSFEEKIIFNQKRKPILFKHYLSKKKMRSRNFLSETEFASSFQSPLSYGGAELLALAIGGTTYFPQQHLELCHKFARLLVDEKFEDARALEVALKLNTFPGGPFLNHVISTVLAETLPTNPSFARKLVQAFQDRGYTLD